MLLYQSIWHGQDRSQPSGNRGSFFSDSKDFFHGLIIGVPSDWGNLDFKKMITLLGGQSSNVHGKSTRFYCRAMQCISAAYVVMRCLSVCPSV